MRKIYFSTLFISTAALLSACGPSDPAQIVAQRAAERWDLLISHQPVKAYEYLSPGYRTTHTLDQYVAFIASAKLRWKAAKVVGQECKDDVCTVDLIVDITVPGQLVRLPKDIDNQGPVTEHWIESEGQWYFLPESPAPKKADEVTSRAEGIETPVVPPSPATPQAPATVQPPSGQNKN